jgi:hypothetical protein
MRLRPDLASERLHMSLSRKACLAVPGATLWIARQRTPNCALLPVEGANP